MDLSLFRELLLGRRQQLEELGNHSDRDDVSLDQTRVGRLSRMDAMQGHEMSLEAERRRQQELGQIDAAMERMQMGYYGECEECGGAIAEGRLKIDPAALYCVSCAEKLEKTSQLR